MRDAERITLLVAFLLYGSLLSCFAQDAKTKYQGKVVSVADGNTLTLLVDDKKLGVRLLGIDAPNQSFKDGSRENLSRLINGKSVIFLSVPLELKEGKEKLLAGKVLLNDADVALSQIADGFAWQSYEFEKYQDPKELQLYAETEQHAKESKKGVWSDAFKNCKDAPVKTSVDTSTKSKPENLKRPEVYGSVTVEVIIDESGNVISARALCGHPVLQTEAVKAAYKAKFSPYPTRIMGNIVYNFVPE